MRECTCDVIDPTGGFPIAAGGSDVGGAPVEDGGFIEVPAGAVEPQALWHLRLNDDGVPVTARAIGIDSSVSAAAIDSAGNVILGGWTLAVLTAQYEPDDGPIQLVPAGDCVVVLVQPASQSEAPATLAL